MIVFPLSCSLICFDGFPSILFLDLDGGTIVFPVSCSLIWMVGRWLSQYTVPWSGWWGDCFPSILFPDLDSGTMVFPLSCSLIWMVGDGFASILYLDYGMMVLPEPCFLVRMTAWWFSPSFSMHPDGSFESGHAVGDWVVVPPDTVKKVTDFPWRGIN